jgi:hypothetical protein
MIKGKPLPPAGDVPPPTEDEINVLVARWNDNCLPYYKGLLEAQDVNTPNPTARFLYDPLRMIYIHRTSGRELTRREVMSAFRVYTERIS